MKGQQVGSLDKTPLETRLSQSAQFQVIHPAFLPPYQPIMLRLHLSPASLTIDWVCVSRVSVSLLPLSFSGETLKKKKHLPSFFPVVPPPEKKLQSVAAVQAPQPLPLKVPPGDPSPTGAHQVSVGPPVTPCFCCLIRDTTV